MATGATVARVATATVAHAAMETATVAHAAMETASVAHAATGITTAATVAPARTDPSAPGSRRRPSCRSARSRSA